jgi:hypothetical protein
MFLFCEGLLEELMKHRIEEIFVHFFERNNSWKVARRKLFPRLTSLSGEICIGCLNNMLEN